MHFSTGLAGRLAADEDQYGQGRHTRAMSSVQVQQSYNMSAVLFLQGHIRKPNGSASAPQGHSSVASLLYSCSCISLLQAPDFQCSIYPCHGSAGISLVMISARIN